VLGSTWQHLAAAPPQAHLSCTRDKKLARPATGRFGWLLGTKACTLAILHRQKIKSATVSHLPAPCFFLFAPRTADTKLASSCVHAQRRWHFTESDGAVSNAILTPAF
jgi:hypothetical protein